VKPKLRVVPITQLILDEKNANKGTKRGRELLEESLGKDGAGRSVVVDRHDRVIAGNKTVEATARSLPQAHIEAHFGWAAMAVARGAIGPELIRRIAYQLVAACPEAMYLLSLWWIRQALATFARGDLYAPIISRMLNRVGAMLATGAFLNIFVVPAVDRFLGFGPGYWVAFDVTGLVLGAIGLSLAIVARVLDRARTLKAELDEIYKTDGKHFSVCESNLRAHILARLRPQPHSKFSAVESVATSLAGSRGAGSRFGNRRGAPPLQNLARLSGCFVDHVFLHDVRCRFIACVPRTGY